MFASILGYAQQLLAAAIQPGDTVIDATVGNGVDTLFLAEAVGPAGTVYGFDIQAAALTQTQLRLRKVAKPQALGRVHLFQHSHGDMLEIVPDELLGQVAAVTFNLGYLPGGDHAIVTLPASTLAALEAARRLLRPGGVLTIALYRGHEGGPEEAIAVEEWARSLPQQEAQVLSYQFLNQRNLPPYLIAVMKRDVTTRSHDG